MYDGDGNRVKSTFNGTATTYFVGNHYEVTGSTITKYYYAGAQRVAMRTNGTLNYLLGDHLGSTSLTTNASGQIVSELRYKAWGETRFASGTTPTKYTYTGQYSYVSDFGLHFYNARWYDSSLGRFAQADTIIPRGVQGYDRYAYSNNNPVVYTDPSGHCGIGFLISLFGGSYSCPTDGSNRIEGFTPVSEDIGLEIHVPVSEDNGLEGFDPAPEGQGPLINVPAPGDDEVAGFDPVPDDELGVIAETEGGDPLQNLANDVADEFGTEANPARGNDWEVTLEGVGPGRRNIVTRMMWEGGERDNPYYRVGVDGLGGLTEDGRFSSDRRLTHHDIDLSNLPQHFRDIVNLIKGIIK